VKEITEIRLNWTMSVKLSIDRDILLRSFKKNAQANMRIDVLFSHTNSKSKRYFCWRRCRRPQRMYNTLRRLRLAASISSLI